MYKYFKVHIAWRKCVRRIWGLPCQIHCSLMSTIYGDNNIHNNNIQLLKRCTSFFEGLCRSNNKLVHLCEHLSRTSNSIIIVNRNIVYERIKL